MNLEQLWGQNRAHPLSAASLEEAMRDFIETLRLKIFLTQGLLSVRFCLVPAGLKYSIL